MAYEEVSQRKKMEIRKPFSPLDTSNSPTGRRIIDLDLLAKGTSTFSCGICGGNIALVNEANKRGLSSTLVWRCGVCSEQTAIPTSEHVHTPNGTRAEVNLLAVGATEMIGKGYTALDSFLGQMGVPNMAVQTFADTALVFGKAVETVATESLQRAREEEKGKLIGAGIQPDEHGNLEDKGITDGAWQKRSYHNNSNSLSGTGVLVGKQTGKLLDFDVLSIKCRTCDIAKRKGSTPEAHECSATWSKSAKSMEPEMAARMWSRSGRYGIHFSTQIGDEDSSTEKRLKENVPSHLQPNKKEADILHIKRNYSNHLYKAKPNFKRILTKGVITKLSSDFIAAITNNTGNKEQMRKAILNIPDHNYGLHSNCGDWCKAKSDPNHKPKLPNGQYLSDQALRKVLDEEAANFTRDDMLEKLVNAESSQRAELAFSMLSKLAPKDMHLSSSPTLKRRVRLMATQYNAGVTYSKLIWNKLGIKVSKQRVKFLNKISRSSKKHQTRKKLDTVRLRRKVLKQQRSQKNKNDTQNEPVSYKSGMGVEEALQSTLGKRKRRSEKELDEARTFKCGFAGCSKAYVNRSGLLQHQRNKHPQ